MFITPKTDCEHISKTDLIPLTDFNPYDIMNQTNDEDTLLYCMICKENDYLFICLSCKLFLCFNHLSDHAITTNKAHPIYLSFDDLSLWCTECISFPYSLNGCYIKSPLAYDYIQYLFELKYDLPYFALISKEEIYQRKYTKFIHRLKNNDFKEVVFMVGAGISTTAGIPDFRSQTGLFKQLQEKYNMNSPEQFFFKSTFLENPMYFYEFCKYFDLSKIEPTITHKFMAFMVFKNIVKYVFTQNIDGLEIKAGIPREKIVFAHGTFEEGHCPTCKCPYDIEEIKKGIEQGEVKICSTCNGPCKPHVVFYGEQLSDDFFQKGNEITSADLGIVMGTSLKVYPFAALPKLIHKEDSWRIAINRSKIGNFKYDYLTANSLFLSGTTDDIVKQIIHDCDWDKEFNDYISNKKIK